MIGDWDIYIVLIVIYGVFFKSVNGSISMKFKVAIVGHSQVPSHLDDLPSPVEVQIFRSPGATARSFFNNDHLTAVFNGRYDMVILWLGSNDIHSGCKVTDIVSDIKSIVEQLEARCTPKVKICLIEPRLTETRWRPQIEQEAYNKVAKGVNNKLQKRALRGKGFITFGAKPFWYSLKSDGVRFDREGRERVKNKLTGAICNAHVFQPEEHWGYSQTSN